MGNTFLIGCLFCVISILFAVEASTSLARVAGLSTNSLASGLQLQSGLSLFSRALMAIFMPTLGALADSGKFNPDNLFIVFYSTGLIPIFVYATHAFRYQITKIYRNSTLNLIEKGSYFPLGISHETRKIKAKQKFKLKALTVFRVITFISYVPYYLSWSLIILLLSIYPEDRGLIMGLSSTINGLNTLALIMCIDPFLIRLERHKRLSSLIYHDQIKIRVLSTVVSSVPFVFGAIYLSFIA